MTSARDADGNVTTFIYSDSDNAELLTEVEYSDGTWLKFTYNIVGQRTQSEDQSEFTVNYIYDALGRLSELTDGDGDLIVLYTYDAAGNLIQKDNGNRTFTIYTYDGDENILSITNDAPSTDRRVTIPPTARSTRSTITSMVQRGMSWPTRAKTASGCTLTMPTASLSRQSSRPIARTQMD